MPVISAAPRPLIQGAQLIGAKPNASKTQSQNDKQAAFAETLARTDMYVSSGSQMIETAALGLFNSYRDTQAAMLNVNNGTRMMANFVNVGSSVKRAVIQRSVTSSAVNGWRLARGKISASEAGGRVVGDVGSTAVSSAVGAVATNVAVWGLARAGVSPLPVMIGGMVAGWAANNLTSRVLVKTGVTGTVVNTTTRTLQSLGN